MQCQNRAIKGEGNDSVFCVCRLTDTGTQMVQCAAWEDWFHTACISIPKKYIHNLAVEM